MLSAASLKQEFSTNIAERPVGASVPIENGLEVSVRPEVARSTELQVGALDQTLSGGTPKTFTVFREEVRPANKASIWDAILQSWEGRVIDVDPESGIFTAVLSDRTNKSNLDEYVEIEFRHIKDSDKELVRAGAVFYWNIGRFRMYKNGRLGPSKNHFEIRFRRLPPLSQQALEEIRRNSSRMALRFHGN